MINKLEIKKKDFKQFKLLRIMNLKFNLDIKDIDIEKLYLRNKNLDNDIINHLAKINFNKLKVFDFYNNNILDLGLLNN